MFIPIEAILSEMHFPKKPLPEAVVRKSKNEPDICFKEVFDECLEDRREE